jgi:hypothetical protein
MTEKQLAVDLDALLNEQQAANFLGFTNRALQAWRMRGGGPAFVKVSARAIRYRRRDLIQWAEDRLRLSTSDTGNALKDQRQQI